MRPFRSGERRPVLDAPPASHGPSEPERGIVRRDVSARSTSGELRVFNMVDELADAEDAVVGLNDGCSGVVVMYNVSAKRILVFADASSDIGQVQLNNLPGNMRFRRVVDGGFAQSWDTDCVVEYESVLCCADCLNEFVVRLQQKYNLG